MCHAKKNLKRRDKSFFNLNEKECERFKEISQMEDLLGGSKGNDVHDFFLFN